MGGEELFRKINRKNEELKDSQAKNTEGGLFEKIFYLGVGAAGAYVLLETGSKLVKKALESPSDSKSFEGYTENKKANSIEENIDKPLNQSIYEHRGDGMDEERDEMFRLEVEIQKAVKNGERKKEEDLRKQLEEVNMKFIGKNRMRNNTFAGLIRTWK